LFGHPTWSGSSGSSGDGPLLLFTTLGGRYAVSRAIAFDEREGYRDEARRELLLRRLAVAEAKIKASDSEVTNFAWLKIEYGCVALSSMLCHVSD